METLGEDILLLAVQPTGKLSVWFRLRYALSGSELVRLAVARRVDVVDDRIVVLDPRPTGDLQLDAALADIMGARKPPKAKEWVAKDRKGLLDAYLARLEAAGALRKEQRQALKIFAVTRWHVLDGARAAAVRKRLDRIAFSWGPVNTAQSALGGLVYAVGLGTELYPGREGKLFQKRLEEVAKRDKTARAVHGAVRAASDAAVEASTDAAVFAATDAAVSSSVDAAVSASVDAAVTAAVDASVAAAVDAAVSASVDAAVSATHSSGDSGGGHAGGGHH